MPKSPKLRVKRLGRPPTSRKSSSSEPARPSRSPSSLRQYLSTIHGYKPIEWIRSGIPALDLVIGAGIPRSRFIEIGGEPSTAKSALLYTIMGAYQRAGAECVLIDSEKKADKDFLIRLGVDWDKLHYDTGDDMFKCKEILMNVAKMATPDDLVLIGWDSLAQTRLPEAFEKHVEQGEDYKPDTGSTARYLSDTIKTVFGELLSKGVTLIALNQLRTQINFMGPSPSVTPGGKAPKFAAAVRLMTRVKGKIKHKTHDVVTGMLVEVEAIKNQMAPPFRKCLLRFNFDTGFAPYSGLDEFLLKHGRLQQKAGWLAYRGKTFRAGDLERVISEVPDIILPLDGVLDTPGKMDLGSGEGPKKEAEEAKAEEPADAE